MSRSANAAAFAALQKRYDEIKAMTYSPQLKELVSDLMKDIPQIKDDTSRMDKITTYILRAKVLLLLPTYSAEAEADLNRALKLDPSSSADTYVALSECLWRKNQEEEAIDSIHSALEIDGKHIGALCQMSRLVRALASKATTNASSALSTPNPASGSSATAESASAKGPSPTINTTIGSAAKTTPSNSPALKPSSVSEPTDESNAENERAGLLQKSVDYAKKALAVDIRSGEAWSALGLAHIQVAVATGFGYAGLKRALAAMQQAVARCPENPDIHYNYAVVLEATGNYSLAATEYAKASEIDPMLKGANKSADNCKLTIERHVSCAKEAKKNETLKKELLFKLPSAKISPNGLVTVGSIAELSEEVSSKTTLSASSTSSEGEGEGHTAVGLMVVGLISPPGVYPLCYHCVDRNAESCMLLVPRLQAAAIQKRDIVAVTIPPCSLAAVEQKNVRNVSLAAAAASAPAKVEPAMTTSAKKKAAKKAAAAAKSDPTQAQGSSTTSAEVIPVAKVSPTDEKKAGEEEGDIISLFMSTIIAADPDAILVNSLPVPEKLYVPAAMSSRLFQ